MGPCLDVYALSHRRDLSTVLSFVGAYSSSDLGAHRDEFELMVLPEGFEGDEDSLPLEKWNAVLFETLNEAIRYGLEDGSRAFRLYLDRVDPWCGALIAFTRSNEVVFGVSVDDRLGEPAALQHAEELRSQLAEQTDGRRTWIVAEEPPPLDPERDEPWLRSLA